MAKMSRRKKQGPITRHFISSRSISMRLL